MGATTRNGRDLSTHPSQTPLSPVIRLVLVYLEVTQRAKGLKSSGYAESPAQRQNEMNNLVQNADIDAVFPATWNRDVNGKRMQSNFPIDKDFWIGVTVCNPKRGNM